MIYSASQQISEPENLLAAWRQVQQPLSQVSALSQLPGLKRAVRLYEQNLRVNLQRLAQRLQRGQYRPAVPDDPLVARLDDAVIQRATLNVLKPLLARKPSDEVRDAQSALNQLRASCARGAEYVVIGALAAFPHTLDRTLLLRRLEAQLTDRPLLALLDQWCAAGLLFAAPSEPGVAALFRRAFANLRETALHLAQGFFARWVPQTRFTSDEQFAAHVWETAANARALEDETLRQQLRQEARQRLLGALLVTGVTAGLLWLSSGRLRRWAGLPKPGLLTVLGAAGSLLAAFALVEGKRGAPGYPNLTPQTQAALEHLLANELLRDFDSAVTGAGWTLVRRGIHFAIPVRDTQSAQAAHRLAEQALWQMGWELDPEQTGVVDFAEAEELLYYHFAD